MSKKLQPSVLIIEDQESIASIIKYNLNKEGFNISIADDGAEGLEMVKSLKPDIVLLDWMLPSISGIEICKLIRSTPGIENTPIIMISARNEEMDKIAGLDRGADDYITKPFSPNELIARVRSVLRRIRPVFSDVVIDFEGLVVDLGKHSVTRDGHEIKLSPIEFKILQTLIEQPGRVLSRDQLMDKIWGTDIYIGSRTIDVHITRLRKALLSVSPDGIDIIVTIRLAGYALKSRFSKPSSE